MIGAKLKFFKDYSKQDQEILAETICPKATEAQINYYLRVCDSKNISPFSGLLYLTLRKNNKTGEVKASVAPTVDGSRLSASRSGEYAGSDEPEYDTETEKAPKWCRVTVYRMAGKERRAYTAKCRFDEFKPSDGQDFQWRSKPYHMLAKVTEVQALRKGFPDYVYGAGDDDDNSEIFADDIPNTATPSTEEVTQRDNSIQFQIAVQNFAKFGFSEADVLKELGLEGRSQVTEDHMEVLRRLYKEHVERPKGE